MSLDIFDIKLGPDAKMPRLDAENTGLVAVSVLDAVQTIVNVLTDAEGGGWKVGFDPTINAYTDRSSKRTIVVSVKPLLDAKPGDPLAKVAAIMTGFAVHEVGHTKLNFYTAIAKRWPGKKLPKVIGNIIEDVVLEARTCERYAGFADHGNGNIFRPTLEWVAELTSPKFPLEWKGSTGHKVNVVGQIVRYRDFTTYSGDPETQAALAWVEAWAKGMTADLTPQGAVTLVEELLDYIKASLLEEEPEPEGPTTDEGPTTEGGKDDGQEIPDEDSDEPKGSPTDAPPDGEGEPDDDESGEGNGEAEDGDDDSDEEPKGSGSGDEDPDGEADDPDGEDGDGDGEGEPSKGDGNDADHNARTEAPKGANDGDGQGGSGQAVSEADPDAGFDETEVSDSFDKVADPNGAGYEQRTIAAAEADERVTTRMDAGAHGKMRVIFR